VVYLLVGCQAVLLGVFGASALGKVRGRTAWLGFVGSVRDLRLVPERMAVLVAAVTVAGEIAVVPLLVVPILVPAGLVLAGGLLVMFIVSIVVTLRRRVSAVCRCFGPVSALPLGRRHVVRNGLLVGVVAVAAVSWLQAHGAPQPAGLLVSVVAGLVGAVAMVFFDDIVELFTGDSVGAGPREQRRA
jgi:hypothetical protein